MLRLASLLLICSTAFLAQADNRYLLPVPIGDPVDGAYGSRWGGEVWAHNGSAGEITIYTSDSLCAITCPIGGTFRVGAARSSSLFSSQPTFLLLSSSALGGDIDLVRFSARIFDESRASTDWGTEIPIVPESAFLISGVTLLNVPVESTFRQTVRIYEWERQAATSVLLRAFDLVSGALIGEVQVALEPLQSDQAFGIGYLENDLLTLLPQVAAHPRVRLEIKPLTPQRKIWAFVSVTHNETQRVTLIRP